MKKIILWSLVSVLIAGIAVGAFLWLHKPQVITLSGGTKLTLVGVTYGKHHVAPKIKVAGRSARGGGARIDSTNDTVVVWIEAEHKPNQYLNYQLMVYDKANTACVSTWTRTQSQIKNGVDIQGFRLDAYPRWDRKIILRAMSYGQRGPQAAKGEFVVSNPARNKSFVKWTPEPLPDTQSDGDLNVTLTRLVYDAPFNRGMATAKPNDTMNKAVLAAFHTEQKGVVVTNWQPVAIETSDAAGNHVQNNSWSSSRDDTGDATMTYQWGLWPDESPWKLRVEMSRTAGFNDDEVWAVQNVPVQPGRQMDFWNYGGRNQTNAPFAETTLNGVHLKLYPAVQFTDQNFNGQKQGGFRVVADPPPEDGFRMTLAKATDDQGREIQNWNPSWGGGNYGFQLQNIRNAKSLNLTIALHKSRFVEFTVKPAKQ